MTVNKIHDYWRTRTPEGFQSERAYRRSKYLLSLIDHFPKEIKIIELGSGVGRNLSILYNAGFRNLNGIEISELYLNVMRESYPELKNGKIHHNSIESIISNLLENEYDLVYTMAFLEHLPYESSWVFKEISRICNNHLITIEDEHTESWRHFPRNYKTIFEATGFKQKNCHIMTKRQGFFTAFRCRVFTKSSKGTNEGNSAIPSDYDKEDTT